MWSDHTLMLLAREKQALFIEEARQERLLQQLRKSQPRPALEQPGLISRIAGQLRRRIPSSGQFKRTKEQPC